MTDAPAPDDNAPAAPEPGEAGLSVSKRLRLGLILVLLFIASGWIAKQLAVPPANVTMLWLPSGVAVGAVLLYGRWLLPAVFLGSISLNLILGVSLGSGLVRAAELAVWTATGAALQALTADVLLRRHFGDHVELTRPSDVAAAIALTALLPALVSSSIGHLALMAVRDFPVDQVPGSMATWAMGDILGILTVAPFAMIGEHRRFRAEWRGAPIRGLFGYIALGCGLGLALTLFAWINARARVHEARAATFAVLTTESEQALHARLNRAAQSLDAASALFSAGDRVTWAEWVAYAKVIDVEHSYPGIDDIGFIRYVPSGSEAAFLAESRRRGLPIDRIQRATPGRDSYVISYIYPLAENRTALGVDIAFDPARRETADRARDTGRAIITPPINFIQYRGPGHGFSMLRPVYSVGEPPRTVAERRKALFGWVYHPFTAQGFLTDLTPAQRDAFDLRIRVRRQDGSWTVVFGADADNRVSSTFVAENQFSAAGQDWLMEWRSTPAFEARMRSVEPLLVLLTGLTINLALAAVLFVVARREAVVTREVERATAELSEANRLLLMTEATTHVGHWRYDIADGTLFWSEEVYRIHGRDPSCPITRDEGLAYIDAEDRDRAWQALLLAVRDQSSFTLRVRIQREGDGEMRNLSFIGRAETGVDGKPGALFGVIQDVTNETRVRDQLLRARDAAQREAQVRGSFLANLSHEIRTPMNGVIGFAELLLETRLAAEQRNYAQIIVESGTNMMSLLNDVLDLSKIEAGHMDLSDEPVALEDLANSAIRMLMPSVRRRQVWLEVQIDPALPLIVRGDKLRLRQVLLNLLGNAVKFTQQGFVRLEISQVGDLMRFAVVDSGPGIPPERLADIFKSFVQLDPSARSGGTGLGLTISSSLVRLMGGSLKVNSRLGEGSSFHFSLPCIPASTEDDASNADEDAAAPPRDVPPAANATRILLAEDNEINQALIRATAARLGLTLDVASNGSDAVVRAETAAQAGLPYDLILMDIQMPVLDGIGATRRLRSMGYSAETLPIVALSANVYQNDIDACFAAGMQAHLAKPVRREALEQAIATWARQRPGATPRESIPQDVPPAEPLPPALVKRYAERRSALAEALRTFELSDAEDAKSIAALMSDIHKLAGTAGHFGDIALGDAARATERAMIDASPKKRMILAQALLEMIESSSETDKV